MNALLGGTACIPRNAEILTNVLKIARQCTTINIRYIGEEVRNMKNATVSARVEADVKVEAEAILQQLGIPISVVINSLYRQIILTRGIPFELQLPEEPKALDEMSKEELWTSIKGAYEESERGEGRALKELMAELEGSL